MVRKLSLLRLAGTIAVIGTLVGMGWLLRRNWAPIFFWAYVALAILTFILGLSSLAIILRRRSVLDPLALDAEVFKAAQNKSAFHKNRFKVVLVLSTVAEAIAWPASIVSIAVAAVRHRLYASQTGSLAYWARLSLNPPLTALSLATAVLVALVFAADWVLQQGYGYRHTLLLVLALGVMTKHLAILCSMQPMSKTLRLSLFEPHLGAIAIGLADLVALILAFAGYGAAREGVTAGIDEVRSAAVDLVTLAKLRAAVLSGTSMNWQDGLVALAGGLLIVNGFKSIYKRQEFNRTNDDFHRIAAGLLTAGEHRESRKWLDKVEKPEAVTHELLVAYYLAANDLANAEQAATNFADEKKLTPAARKSEIYRVLVNATSIPIPKETLKRCVSGWISGDFQETFLVSAIDLLVRTKKLGPDEVLDTFENDEARVRHALSFAAVLLTVGGDPEEFLHRYEPSVPAERLVHACMLYRCLWVKIVDHQDELALDAIRRWADQNMDGIRQAATMLYTDYERLAALEHVYLLSDLAGLVDFRSDKAQLDELASAIKDDLGGDERVMVGLRAIESMSKARTADLRKLITARTQVAAWIRASAGVSRAPELPGPA